MTSVIQAEGLGKQYRRGLNVRRSDTLREMFTNLIRSPLAPFRHPQRETFWALRDVSLEVREGEVLGLIGRNGAGKTTLLKILSRITRPTTGWAEIRGRVRSLLEVGTGFHGELSGRENAYLSGSILGMSRSEIDRKFDEIVAFAEIDKFIDTPVKHYSSGMYVRLAFAVAAHLELEILLVDEVLAVGDINFQKKCLGKMDDVSRAGRTVVLVSHQLNQIRRLCERVIWIDDGRVRQKGPAHPVLSAYESAMRRGDRDGSNQSLRHATKARFLDWEIVEPQGDNPHSLNEVAPTMVAFIIDVAEPVRRGHHGIALYNSERQLIWGRATDGVELTIGQHEFRYQFPMMPLRPGPYSWHVSLYDDGEEVDAWECVPDMVVAIPSFQHTYDRWNGVLNIPTQFSVHTKTTQEL